MKGRDRWLKWGQQRTQGRDWRGQRQKARVCQMTIVYVVRSDLIRNISIG